MSKLKDYLKDSKIIKKNSFLRSFKTYLNYPFLWRLNCDSVSRGVAVGLSSAMIPLIPFQTLIAALLAVLFRANLPIAIIVSWVSNPFTIIPIAYLTYKIGHLLIDGKTASVPNLSWKYAETHEVGSTLIAQFVHYGKAYIVGLVIVFIATAILGYLLTFGCWHCIHFLKKSWHMLLRK